MTENEKFAAALHEALVWYDDSEFSQDALMAILHEASEDIDDPELKLWQRLLATVDSITRYGYATVPANEALEALEVSLEF